MIAQCWRPWEMTTTANFPPGSIKAKLLDRLQRSRSDPCYFNEKVLCRSPYWRAQREWALALVDHRIVAVETGNMLGKGFLIGGVGPMVLMDTKAQSCLYLRGWTNPDRERPLQGDPPGGSELTILESRSLADDDQSRHQVFSGDSDNPARLGCARVFHVDH